MEVFSSLSPDQTVLLGTVGAGFILYEFHRPGRVFPAALGILLVLLVTGLWMAHGTRPWAAALLAVATAGCLLNAWRALPVFVPVLAIVGLIGALRFLAPAGAQQVSTPTALLCGGAFGAVCSFLSRIAYRARRAKALD